MKLARALDLDNAVLWVPWVWVTGEVVLGVAVMLWLATRWERRLYHALVD